MRNAADHPGQLLIGRLNACRHLPMRGVIALAEVATGVRDEEPQGAQAGSCFGLETLVAEAVARTSDPSPLLRWAKQLAVKNLAGETGVFRLPAIAETCYVTVMAAITFHLLPHRVRCDPAAIRHALRETADAGDVRPNRAHRKPRCQFLSLVPEPYDWFTLRPTDSLQEWLIELEEAAQAFASQCTQSARSGEDLWRPLYESLFPKSVRQVHGEFYTPDWLADFVLEQVGFPDSDTPRLVDPACGSGTFLLAAVRRLRRVGTGKELWKTLFGTRVDVSQPALVGLDTHRPAVLAARYNLLATLAEHVPAGEEFTLPVSRADALTESAELAPLCETFDFLVGNPPWVLWDHLSPRDRELRMPLWREYGLFTLDGSAAQHGGAKKDLSALVLLVGADRLMRHGGRLGMLVPRSLLHAKGAGDGFRRFHLARSEAPLGITGVEDFSAIDVFPRTSNRTLALFAEKGRSTTYPVRYRRWKAPPTRQGNSANARGASQAEAHTLSTAMTDQSPTAMEFAAAPADATRLGSPWLLQPASAEIPWDRLVGPSAYRAHLGANTGGANGVYWVEIVATAGRNVIVRNLAECGRPAFPKVELEIEPDLLFPLIRWRDLGRFAACTAAYILMPQDPQRRRGIPEEILKETYPLTFQYLQQFSDRLNRRAAYQRFQSRAAWYSMYNVGTYTFAPWKVVWRRMDRQLTAAVVGPGDDGHLGWRPLIPQETCVLVACGHEQEAHYLAAVLNSSWAQLVVGNYCLQGSKGFGSPHILDVLAIPQFDPDETLHGRLAALGAEAARAAQNVGQGVAKELDQALDRAAAALWKINAPQCPRVEPL